MVAEEIGLILLLNDLKKYVIQRSMKLPYNFRVSCYFDVLGMYWALIDANFPPIFRDTSYHCYLALCISKHVLIPQALTALHTHKSPICMSLGAALMIHGRNNDQLKNSTLRPLIITGTHIYAILSV